MKLRKRAFFSPKTGVVAAVTGVLEPQELDLQSKSPEGHPRQVEPQVRDHGWPEVPLPGRSRPGMLLNALFFVTY